jgi:hypothetical protein
VESRRASLLGRGLSFPLRLGSDGEFVKVNGEDNVDECVIQLLRTRKGERPFAVRDGILFGTDLHRVLFENEDIAVTMATQTIREALAVWEPRVELLDIAVFQQEATGGALLVLSVKYLIKSTNNIRNLVLPQNVAA